MSERRTANLLATALLGGVAVLFVVIATSIAVYVERHDMQRRHFAEVEAIRSQLVNPQIMIEEPEHGRR
jgi:hypothetical protein